MRFFYLFLLMTLPLVMPASAQEPTTATPLKSRWVVTATGTAGVSYTDNLLRMPDNGESDILTSLSPGIEARAKLGSTRVRLLAEAEKGFYSDNSGSDYLDAGFRGYSTTQVHEDTIFNLKGGYKYDHVPIGGFDSTSDRIAVGPTTYRRFDLDLGTEHTLDEVRAGFDINTTNFNYDNMDRKDSTRLIQDDRDRWEMRAGMQIGYQVSPQWQPYIATSANSRAYNRQIDGTAAIGRDSVGYDALAGMKWQAPDKTLELDAAAGYMGQDYEAAAMEDVHTVGAKADIIWHGANGQKIMAGYERSVGETTNNPYSSKLQDAFKLGGETPLSDPWTLASSARLITADFQHAGGAADRLDRMLDLSLELEYLIMEGYAVGGKYALMSRTSDVRAVEFDSNTVMVYGEMKY